MQKTAFSDMLYGMSPEFVTKRSPIVPLLKFAAIEAAAIVLYFFATLFGDAKYQLYIRLPLSNFLSYQDAKIIILSGIQFVLTIYTFLAWYYDEYIVRPRFVTHRRGILRRKERTVPVTEDATFSVSQSVFSKVFHYGSVYLKDGPSTFAFKDVSHPERIAQAVHEQNAGARAFGPEPDIKMLLAKAEHERLEFKSSLRFDYKTGVANRDVEKAAMKTVAALLNSQGGYLVLGVSDDRSLLGLNNDYRTLQRKDRDGFENHFTQSFNSMIGPEFRSLVKLWFCDAGQCELCVAEVLPSPRPAYFKADNNEHFYMRTGNISTSLKLSEIDAYSRSRWPRRINEA